MSKDQKAINVFEPKKKKSLMFFVQTRFVILHVSVGHSTVSSIFWVGYPAKSEPLT